MLTVSQWTDRIAEGTADRYDDRLVMWLVASVGGIVLCPKDLCYQRAIFEYQIIFLNFEMIFNTSTKSVAIPRGSIGSAPLLVHM